MMNGAGNPLTSIRSYKLACGGLGVAIFFILKALIGVTVSFLLVILTVVVVVCCIYILPSAVGVLSPCAVFGVWGLGTGSAPGEIRSCGRVMHRRVPFVYSGSLPSCIRCVCSTSEVYFLSSSSSSSSPSFLVHATSGGCIYVHV